MTAWVRRRGLGVLFLTAAFASMTGVTPVAAQAPEQPGRGPVRISLVTQTPWVGADGAFLMVLAVISDEAGTTAGGGRQALDPSAYDVDISLFSSVASRTAFAESIGGRGLRSPIAPITRARLADLARDADGNRVVQLPTPPTKRNGVHPVRVELRDSGTGNVVDRFVTHLVYVPEPNVGPRLAVSLVLPVHLSPRLEPDGERLPVDTAEVAAMTQALQSVAGLPVTLAPTPETLTALVASGGDTGGLLTALRQVAAQRRTVAGSYVPLKLPVLLASGLEAEMDTQATKGSETIAKALRDSPDPTTWAAEEPLDAASVDLLAGRGVERIVAAESALTPLGDRLLTLTRPFRLEGEAAQVPAVAADTTLSGYFADTEEPVLAAAHLLSDLAVLHFDQPGDRRAAVAMPARSWQPTRRFMDLVAAGLAGNPILEPVEVHTLFETVTPEVGSGPRRDGVSPTLIRQPVVSPVVTQPAFVRGLGTARRRLASLDLVLGAESLVSADLDERLLVALSADLRGPREPDSYLSGVRRAIDAQLEGVDVPQDRSITLTARRGEIPVTFRNRTGHPLSLAVRLESDKLDFPGGTRQLLELTRLNTTQRFPVVARTSGAFPIRITLESPDGLLVAGEATLTVRSTAAPGLGLGISVGAALFLAVWWGRNLAKRDRRGTPIAGAGGGDGSMTPANQGES